MAKWETTCAMKYFIGSLDIGFRLYYAETSCNERSWKIYNKSFGILLRQALFLFNYVKRTNQILIGSFVLSLWAMTKYWFVRRPLCWKCTRTNENFRLRLRFRFRLGTWTGYYTNIYLYKYTVLWRASGNLRRAFGIPWLCHLACWVEIWAKH